MKQARRKELKTNELIQYLKQLRETAARNYNYIMGGVVVVVAILAIGLWVQHNRREAEASRWREYEDIQKAAMENKTDVIDRAASLAQAAAQDPILGARAKELYAQLSYEKAMSTSTLSPSPEQIALLEQAKSAYQDIINMSSSRPEVVARARMGVASVAETLYVLGKDDLNVAREQYKQLIASKTEPYADMAQQQLDTLAERTSKMEIVATRPAEVAATAPAKAPAVVAAPLAREVKAAPTTRPAAASAPSK